MSHFLDNSIQQELAQGIKETFSDAEVKKIDVDNFLDIHVPAIHEKRGTHLFFNTAKGGIKFGFYCRDKAFIDTILKHSVDIEAYAQGLRLADNPTYHDVKLAVKACIQFAEEIIHISQNQTPIIEDDATDISDFEIESDSSNDDEEIDLEALLKEMSERSDDDDNEDDDDESDEDYEYEYESDDSDDEDDDDDYYSDDDDDSDSDDEDYTEGETDDEEFNLPLYNTHPRADYASIEKLKAIILKEPEQFVFANASILRDKKAIKELLKINSLIFDHIPENIQANKDIIKTAVSEGYFNENFAHFIDFKNAEAVKSILNKAPEYYYHLPESLKNEDITIFVIHKLEENFEFESLPPVLQNDLNFFDKMLSSFSSKPIPEYHYASSFLSGYKELYYDNSDFIIKHDLFPRASDDLKADKDFCLKYLKANPGSYDAIVDGNDELFDDYEFAKIAVTLDGTNIRFTNPENRKNKELFKIAIKTIKGLYLIDSFEEDFFYLDDQHTKVDIESICLLLEDNAYQIREIPRKILEDENVSYDIIYAARERVNCLYYAPDACKQNRDFVHSLIKANPLTITFADKKFWSDRELMAEATEAYPMLLKFCDASLKADKNFVIPLLQKNGLVIRYLNDALLSDPDIYWAAIRQTPYAYEFLPYDVQIKTDIVEYIIEIDGSILNSSALNTRTLEFKAYENSNGKIGDSELNLFKSYQDPVSVDELKEILKRDVSQVVFTPEATYLDTPSVLNAVLDLTGYPLRFESCRRLLGEEKLLTYLKKYTWYFKYLTADELSNRTLVKEMLSVNGLLLQFLSETDKADSEYLSLALQQNPNVCYFFPKNFSWYPHEAAVIEAVCRKPHIIEYFATTDYDITNYLYYGLALDATVSRYIDPSQVDREDTDFNLEDLWEDQAVLGLNQDPAFFSLSSVEGSKRNYKLALRGGLHFVWEELFEAVGDTDFVIYAFEHCPNEELLNILKEKLGNQFSYTQYVKPYHIAQATELYALLPPELQADSEYAYMYLRGDNDTMNYILSNLPESFQNDSAFLNKIIELKITWDALSDFFDKKILENPDLIARFISHNPTEYSSLKEKWKINTRIAEAAIMADSSVEMHTKFEGDKDFRLMVAKKYPNEDMELVSHLALDIDYLLEIVKYQPQVIKYYGYEEEITPELGLSLLKQNINCFEHFDDSLHFEPLIFDYIIQNDITLFRHVSFSVLTDEHIEKVKDRKDLYKIVNYLKDEDYIKSINQYCPIEKLEYRPAAKTSDIQTLFYVSEPCEIVLGYDSSTYLSEDVAGTVDEDIIYNVLSDEDDWSSYIWSNSWYNYEDIYHKYGITEPATHIQINDGGIIPLSLTYSAPEFDEMEYCFQNSSKGDFVHISSSDEKAYGWTKWKRYTLNFEKGIFDIQKIHVDFEYNIVDGYYYDYENSKRIDYFESSDDYSTTGKGFESELYFNTGTALESIDMSTLREELEAEDIAFDDIEKIKAYLYKQYS